MSRIVSLLALAVPLALGCEPIVTGDLPLEDQGQQEFNSHNGKDSECSFAYTDKTLDEQETGTFKCKGQGKGRCKITLTSAAFEDCGDQGRINVDHGDTLLVFRFWNGKIKEHAKVSADEANCCGDDISDSECNVRYSNCTAWDFSTQQCADYLECMVNGGEDASCKAAAE